MGKKDRSELNVKERERERRNSITGGLYKFGNSSWSGAFHLSLELEDPALTATAIKFDGDSLSFSCNWDAFFSSSPLSGGHCWGGHHFQEMVCNHLDRICWHYTITPVHFLRPNDNGRIWIGPSFSTDAPPFLFQHSWLIESSSGKEEKGRAPLVAPTTTVWNSRRRLKETFPENKKEIHVFSLSLSLSLHIEYIVDFHSKTKSITEWPANDLKW